MKKFFLAFVAVATALSLCISCGNPNEPTPDTPDTPGDTVNPGDTTVNPDYATLLIGTWSLTEYLINGTDETDYLIEDGDYLFVFNADGTGSLTNSWNGESSLVWSLEDGVITYEFVDEGPYDAHILQLDATTLKWKEAESVETDDDETSQTEYVFTFVRRAE